MDLEQSTGREGQAITLGDLFAHPHFWKPKKACDFYNATHNQIKDGVDLTEFIKDVNAKSSIFRVFNNAKTWKASLSKKEFHEMTCRYTHDKKTVKKQIMVLDVGSFTKLLATIRNKFEHNEHTEASMKESLGWFDTVNNEFRFNPSNYGRFWNSRFPRFTSYLWTKFVQFRHSPALQRFYVGPSTLDLELEDFSKILETSFQHNAEQGNMYCRYRYQNDGYNETCTLEFRSVPKSRIQLLLDGSLFAMVDVVNNLVSCNWYDYTEQNQWHPSDFKTTSISAGVALPSVIFIADDPDKYFENLVIYNIETGNYTRKRIVVICSSQPQNDFAARITHSCKLAELVEFPLNWYHLSENTRQELENQSVITLQGNSFKFNNLLPIDKKHRNDILSNVEGQCLNNLLKTRALSILQTLRIPQCDEMYLSRHLFNISRVHISDLCNFHEETTPFISGISLDQFMLYTGGTIKKVTVLNAPYTSQSYNLHSKVYLVEHILGLQESIKNYTKLNIEKTIHCLRFVEGDMMELVHTIGTLNNDLKVFEASGRRFCRVPESDFLDTVRDESLILLSGKPGMGKSQTLLNLGSRLVGQSYARCVMHFSANILAHNLNNFKCSASNPKSIVQIFVNHMCSNKLEKALVRHWLLHSDKGAVMFELMVDGLDEVEYGVRSLLIDALLAIKEKLASVRLWITYREHMLETMQSKFGVLGYKIEPFSSDLQIQFLTRFWMSYHQSKNQKLMHKIKTFSKRCVNYFMTSSTSQFIGIPLQLTIVGEIFKDSLAFKRLGNSSLTHLYEALLDKKLEIFFKKHHGIDTPTNYIFHTVKLDLLRYHISLALKIIFPAGESTRILDKVYKPHSIAMLNQAALNLGLVVSTRPLEFFHRTFAEFLVAKFITMVLKNKFLEIKENDKYFQIFFTDSILGVTMFQNPWSLDTWFVFHQPVICWFLNDLWRISSRVRDKVTDVTELVLNTSVTSGTFCNEAPLYVAICQAELVNFAAVLARQETHKFELLIAALKSQSYDLFKALIKFHRKEFGVGTWKQLQKYREFSVLHWAVSGICEYSIHSFDEEDTQDMAEIKSILQYIVKKDSTQLETKDGLGRSPLMLLLQYWSLQCFTSETLPVDTSGEIPEIACYFIFDLGSNIYETDSNGNNIFHIVHACDLDNVCAFPTCYMYLFMQYFVKNLWNVVFKDCGNRELLNQVNNNGFTPLHTLILVLKERSIELLEPFVNFGSNINAKDTIGNTVLHMAVQNGLSVNVSKELVRLGCDLTIANGNCKTALQLAIQQGNDNQMKFLMSNMPSSLSKVTYL